MLRLGEHSFSAVDVLTGKVKGLIFGRLALVSLLLLASWWWTNSFLERAFESFPNRLFLLFIVSITLTVLYSCGFLLNRHHLWQVRVQFVVDAFLITWLVGETGGIHSPYITLYIILISTVGFFFGRRETLFIALLSAFSFSMLSLLAIRPLNYSISGTPPPSRYAQIIAFNIVGILIVGLLAAHLSERRRRMSEELRETAESFADLNVLQERILESIRSGLITTDLEGKIYTFNRAAEEISGLSAGEIIGRSVYSLFGEASRSRLGVCFYRAGEDDEFPTEHFEAEIRRPASGDRAGNTKTVACSVAPLVGKASGVYGLIVTFQDITQIRVMEESLRRSDRLAAVGRMAAGLAHEIRNPLGSMSSALQFLQEKVPPATPEAELMEIVLRESDRLNKIITNFLTYARPSSDIFAKNNVEMTDVGAALRDCLVLLRHSPEVQEAHALRIDLPERPVRIKANETQLKQVFWNILRNSIQAMPAGGTLDVRIRELTEKGIEITFEDTGCGINPENLEHLFEPFSIGARGTGLGLSIVHKIVSDHGGHIEVQSRERTGTKVKIELPH